MVLASMLVFQGSGGRVQIELPGFLLQGHPSQQIVDALLDGYALLLVQGICVRALNRLLCLRGDEATCKPQRQPKQHCKFAGRPPYKSNPLLLMPTRFRIPC